METVESALLFKLQKEFPLTSYPFEAMATDLGITAPDCLARVRRLKEDGVIRQISAIFDSRRLGYQSALIAARLAPSHLEAGAAVVSAHPGVSHNYQRDHDFNLWFTLALAPELDFAAEAARLAHAAGAERWMILPSLKTFKIEVALDAGENAASARVEAPKARNLEPVWLSDSDKERVRALQEDIPITEQPFLPVAKSLGLTEEGLFDWMAEAGRLGMLRRFAAILRHRKAGFSYNGMGVWKVPEARIDECGGIFASFKAVSHCYQRPTGPDWPYNLFTMVHAQSEGECAAIFVELARATGLSGYQVLFSSREFKKERVKYFLEGRSLRLKSPLFPT